jgi:N-dimethylarginine dimethylaminohydrolase
LKLATKTFYHLDTAFAALDEETVMIYPAAFEKEGLELIHHFFANVIELTENDANNFAGNAVALRGKKVILQKGSTDACRQLRQAGFEPIELDSSEFMKSGGSFFCIKMLVY